MIECKKLTNEIRELEKGGIPIRLDGMTIFELRRYRNFLINLEEVM